MSTPPRRRRSLGPPFQPLAGWLLLLLGAVGLSYGSWRALNLVPGRSSSFLRPTTEGAAAGVVWAEALFIIIPAMLFAGAGIVLLLRRPEQRKA